jgi:opacity protein-like surface antigen
MASPAFDWSGPYIGVYGGVITDFAIYGARAGVQAGFNIQRGSFVAGLEVQAGAYYAMGLLALEANINAILGFALGDRVLLYGEGGVGVAYAPSIPATAFLWTAGGGLAFAIRDPMSMFAEAKVAAPFGGGPLVYIFQAGLNWHR